MPNAITPSGTQVTPATMAMPSGPYIPSSGMPSMGAMPSMASGNTTVAPSIRMDSTAPTSDLSGYYTPPYSKMGMLPAAFINKDRGVLKYHKLSDAYGRAKQV